MIFVYRINSIEQGQEILKYCPIWQNKSQKIDLIFGGMTLSTILAVNFHRIRFNG